MHVIIIGRGEFGNSLQKNLEKKGVKVTILSRKDGVDINGEINLEKYLPADLVVEATNQFTLKKQVAVDFFTASTRNINNAVQKYNIPKHLLLSIVNCDNPNFSGFGYYAGKAEQLRIARSENKNMSILLTTQWNEFGKNALNAFKFGKFSFIQKMLIRPVALDAITEYMAAKIIENNLEDEIQIAGNQDMTLKELAQKYNTNNQKLIEFSFPGKAGRAMKDGSLIPKENFIEL